MGIAFDEELLYVAAMLHDIGLVTAFDNATVSFDEAGGNVAWMFAAGAGWPLERRVRLSEVIVRHMWESVDPAFDAEGHLLEVRDGDRHLGPRPGPVGARAARRGPRAPPEAGHRHRVHGLHRRPGAAQARQLRRAAVRERDHRPDRGQRPRHVGPVGSNRDADRDLERQLAQGPAGGRGAVAREGRSRTSC